MKTIIKTIKQSTIALLMLSLGFLVIEPAVSIGASVSSQFIVTLGVLSEISFAQGPTNVTLLPALAGLTGGTANGQTQVRAVTNNSTGYTMTLNSSSSLGMIGNGFGGVVPSYVSSVNGVPDYTFTVPANRARYGYTVEASTTADLTQLFKDNGSTTCGTGANDTPNACWLAATTTPVTIINRSSYTPDNGATTTIKFRAVINSNPSPLIPKDTYTSTTTLTITENP